MNIGVFFGSRSPEHDVSIITAELIISEMVKNKNHTVTPVYLSKNGDWFIGSELGNLKFFLDRDIDQRLKKLPKFFIDLEKSNGKIVFKEKKAFGREIQIDLAFPAFHGANGEDGTIQGLFEMFNIPYVGCGVAASAIAMDKVLTKLICASRGIPTADFIFFDKNDWEKNKEKIVIDIKSKLQFPLFVKPPRLGSSIGIAKAENEKELEFGVEVALHYGETVLVENGVRNLKDLTCAVLGNDKLVASEVLESGFEGTFFNYEEKYLEDGGAQIGNAQKKIIIPANIDAEMTRKIKETAKSIYVLIGATGLARIDFLFDEKERKLYVSEINPLPGILYSHLWKASGIELGELIKKLIALASETYRAKNKVQHTFESDLLKFANSIKLNK
jgi:D-alanine-D-alanine ligase